MALAKVAGVLVKKSRVDELPKHVSCGFVGISCAKLLGERARAAAVPAARTHDLRNSGFGEGCSKFKRAQSVIEGNIEFFVRRQRLAVVGNCRFCVGDCARSACICAGGARLSGVFSVAWAGRLSGKVQTGGKQQEHWQDTG